MTGAQAIDRALRDRVEEVQGELKATQVLVLQAEQDRDRMKGEIVELEALLKKLHEALEAPAAVEKPEPGSISPGWFAVASLVTFSLLYVAAWYWYVTLFIVVLVGFVSAVIGAAVVLVLTAARMIAAAHEAFRKRPAQ